LTELTANQEQEHDLANCSSDFRTSYLVSTAPSANTLRTSTTDVSTRPKASKPSLGWIWLVVFLGGAALRGLSGLAPTPSHTEMPSYSPPRRGQDAAPQENPEDFLNKLREKAVPSDLPVEKVLEELRRRELEKDLFPNGPPELPVPIRGETRPSRPLVPPDKKVP
jgi:hypothetical protein